MSNLRPFRRPMSPGEAIYSFWLEAGDMTPEAFAKQTNLSIVQLNDLVFNRAHLTQEYAELLAEGLGTTPELWLNLQRNHDAWMDARKDGPHESWKLLTRACMMAYVAFDNNYDKAISWMHEKSEFFFGASPFECCFGAPKGVIEHLQKKINERSCIKVYEPSEEELEWLKKNDEE